VVVQVPPTQVLTCQPPVDGANDAGEALDDASDGPSQGDGPATDGPASDGPPADGPASDGPEGDGPAIDGAPPTDASVTDGGSSLG
jgi:hypothetical protein